MADIFVSYKREDQEQKGRVRPFVQALQAEGFDVFYDVEIPPGSTWEQVLQSKISAAKCVIVLWSEASVASDWVKEEAEIAKMAGKIIPVFLDPVSAPFGFSRIEGANLVGWNGDLDHVEWKNLVRAVKARIGEPEHTRDTTVTHVPMPVEAPARKSGKGAGGLIALLLGLVVVAGGGYFGYQYWQNSQTVSQPSPAISVEREALREALASRDPDVLRAFLERYPGSEYRQRVVELLQELEADAETPSTGNGNGRPTLINPEVSVRLPTDQIRPLMREDCVSLSGNFQVVRMDGNSGFQVLDRASSSAVLSASGSSAMDEMNQAWEILRQYNLDAQCFIGRPDPALTYYLADGALPSGDVTGEDCLPITRDALSVRQRGGNYLLMNGGGSMISFENDVEANASLQLIQRYEANEICYVGRPGPSMVYLKR